VHIILVRHLWEREREFMEFNEPCESVGVLTLSPEIAESTAKLLQQVSVRNLYKGIGWVFFFSFGKVLTRLSLTFKWSCIFLRSSKYDETISSTFLTKLRTLAKKDDFFIPKSSQRIISKHCNPQKGITLRVKNQLDAGSFSLHLRWKGWGRHRQWHSTCRWVPPWAAGAAWTDSAPETPSVSPPAWRSAWASPAGMWTGLDPPALGCWPGLSSSTGLSASRAQTSPLQYIRSPIISLSAY